MTEPTPLPSLAPSSLRSRASDVLRDAIVTGRLRPGDRLREENLAQQLGVSRAPIREALRQLEHEGLVASSPYRATEVLGISQEEITEVLVPIRLTLETFAFRKARTLLTDDDFATLAALVDRMRAAAKSGDLDDIAEADLRFHELVIQRAEQPHCLQVWRTIEPRVRAYFRRDAAAHAPLDELAEEHDELLQALRHGRESGLVRTIRSHITHYFAPEDLPDRP